ncbi:hypothetical protein VP1G_02766 [Cytospora mali]|uniref:Extracellular membrane protein CFEM domain-containing protein n=1 Tax=Cytospora mali TaxID=578113 RepID=A0A194UUN2_CYTMA|nr:hypothetical protein VP1G_02766 [Valsa mali var. pyri (nom. inval.)]
MEVAKRTGLLLLWATTIPVVLAAKATTTTSATSSTSTSYPFNLGSDITDFIPPCALSCFESFIEVNYNTSICGSSPSLQCLCAHTGSTGYTIGEGAVQCIVAENDVGACKGMDTDSDIVANAYTMCANEPGAASETHATIIATLIVPPTGPRDDELHDPVCHAGINNVKKVNLSLQFHNQYSLVIITITIIIIIIAIIAIIVIVDYCSGSIRDRYSLARGQHCCIIIEAHYHTDRRHRPSPKISAPRYQEPKSMSFTRALAQRVSRNFARPDTIGLAISPEGSGMQGVARQPGETTVAANMPPAAAPAAAPRKSPSPPPIPPLSPLRTQPSFNFFQAPQGSSQQQPPQPQEQQKPALTLAIPPPKTSRYNNDRSSTMSNNRMPFGGGRDSVVTEFAEDGETSAGPGSAQIWRPPNTDPQSSTTYYIADKWGNWVLGAGARPGPDAQVAELPTHASKTVAERREEQERAVPESSAVKAAVRDLSPQKLPSATGAADAAGGLMVNDKERKSGLGKTTIRQVPPDSGRLPVNSRSSSVYSTFSTNYSLPQTVQPGPENPMPATNTAATRKKGLSPNPESYYSGVGGGRPIPSRDLTSRPRKRSSSGSGSGSRDRTNTMMSQDSYTTIASSVESESGVESFATPARRSSVPEPPYQPQGSLSPVVESPGRSPVSYPKIPRLHNVPGSSSNNNTNYPGGQAKRPLQNPATLRVVNAGQPKDSPTLGVVESQKPVQMGTVQAASPAQAHISFYDPAKRQSVNRNPNRNPGQVRSGSPEAIGGASTSLGQTQLQQPSSVSPRPHDTTMSPPLQSFQQRINNRSQLPSQSRYGPMSIYDAYSRPESNYTQGRLPSQQYQQPYPQQYPQQYQQQYQQQHPQQYPQRYPQQYSQQYQQPHKAYQPHPATLAPTPSPLSASDSPSASTSSSSLLAKRLGAERAAAFQMAAPVENRHNSSQERWRRRESSLSGTDMVIPEPDAMMGPPLAPRGLVVRKVGGKKKDDDNNDQGRRDGGGDGPLPATPGWKPQLTPKRRGGDLYLSVQ